VTRYLRWTAGRRVRRVAMLSVHTSPLHQPGTGDAGGMNVYIVELAKRLAERDVEVEIFTRATTGGLPPSVELAPGVLVRHVDAGPYEGLAKEDLPPQLCAFTHGVMRAWAGHRPGHYDLVHSHYWLSGHVGWLAAQRWGVPLVHAMHTMAKVKNAALAEGDTPEPPARVIGETQVVEAADRLIANTAEEAGDLVRHYDADPRKVAVVHPGVDLHLFRPRLGVSDVVRFQPPVDQTRLADWYRAANVLVMPSYSESFGLVAIEAQACGTPVLAAAVGGLPVAVRDGSTGYLVEGHDPGAYAEVLRRFAERPRLTDELGAGGARHAEGFGWDTAAAGTAEVYAAAVRERRRHLRSAHG
jgi:glycosyltransferase involved in cell wall biosynthesis